MPDRLLLDPHVVEMSAVRAAEILEEVGLTPQHIARDVVAQVLGSKIPVARPLDESADPADAELRRD